VRVATIGDLEAVSTLRMALLEEESRSVAGAGPATDAELESIALTRRQLGERNAPIFVAEMRGAPPRIVGILRCALMRRSPIFSGGPIAMLSMVYVAPAFRRKGVQRSLVARAVRWCRAAGASEVRLRCAVDNDGANAAWAALGFSVATVVRRHVLE
jgi:GNAT superfamily N-acetyltransferase